MSLRPFPTMRQKWSGASLRSLMDLWIIGCIRRFPLSPCMCNGIKQEHSYDEFHSGLYFFSLVVCCCCLVAIEVSLLFSFSFLVLGGRSSALVHFHSPTCKGVPRGRGTPDGNLGVGIHLGLDLAQQIALVQQPAHYIPRGEVRKVVHDIRQVDVCEGDLKDENTNRCPSYMQGGSELEVICYGGST